MTGSWNQNKVELVGIICFIKGSWKNGELGLMAWTYQNNYAK